MANTHSNPVESSEDYFQFNNRVTRDIWSVHSLLIAGSALARSLEGYESSYELIALADVFNTARNELIEISKELDESSRIFERLTLR